MTNIKTDIVITEAIQFALDQLKRVNTKFLSKLYLKYDETIEKQGYKQLVENGDVSIMAADESGAMYAILDLADEIRKGEKVSNRKVVPYMENRGIKFNIPLDARTPSYSDASTSASANIQNMWDMNFWMEFLDRMAENKYNVLSLWTMSPFPSLVSIPEYPLASIDDVKMTTRPFHAKLSGAGIYGEDHRKSLITIKKITINEKIRYWQKVMEYAKNRCIRVFIVTWNLFVYGTEDSPYGITENQTNPITKDFVYCGTKSLMETYPLLAGIGVTAGENMTFNGMSTEDNTKFSNTDIGFIAESYGRGIRDYLKEHPDRDFTLIHRMQMARYDTIMEAFTDFPCKFEISFKYSQAHMYSNTKPMFIQEFLKEKAPNVKIWLTVRNDDYYMYRWGDPEFAKEYLANMPKESMAGFYMGPDGFTWGKDYMDLKNDSHPLVIDKMWYMFKIWGQLAYNLTLDEAYFKDEINARFELNNGQKMYKCWQEVSRIIPELNCVHWHDFDFQWYPEGCCMYEHAPMDKICFADINEFISCISVPNGEYDSVLEFCNNSEAGSDFGKVSPLVMAESIWNHAVMAEQMLDELRQDTTNYDYLATLNDIAAMCKLGYYYSLKIRAAVSLATYRLNNLKDLQKKAIDYLVKAAPYWKEYSSMTNEMYKPQVLTRLCGKVDVKEFDTLVDLDILLAKEN